ncbi:MAG: NADH-quinone oxidoreductase subunit C [Deltaproteobacteria bacterium]|nr:NADH-quinone oxidoreductase subunit C [Deltaproteobacteria bacterium]
MTKPSEAAERLKAKFGEAILSVSEFRGEVNVTVGKNAIRDILLFLKNSDDLRYDLLIDLCGVDYCGDDPRFEIVYLLHSLPNNNHLRIKTRLRENETIDTVSDVWKAADWMEREIYDMLGISFNNHPDLRRILLVDDFSGHPLKKDFPLEGPDFDKPFTVQLEEETRTDKGFNG